MKALSLFAAISLHAISSLCAAPQVMNLRYEWSPAPSGPWTPVPETALKVHADGSATALSEASRMFFRLNTGDGPAGGSTIPVMPLVALPAPLLEYVKGILSARDGESTADDAHDWDDVEFAPFATPVTSPWSTDGEPDMAELKVRKVCRAADAARIFPDEEGESESPDRGFMLVSLTRNDPPVLSFATRGATPAEELLARCHGQPVARLTRFSPTFMVAEGSDGKALANAGLTPVLLTDESYEEGARRLSYDWNSQDETHAPLPSRGRDPVHLAYSDYSDLKRKFTGSEWRRQRRIQRATLAEFDWLSMEGRAPALTVKAGEEQTFLTETRFDRISLDEEDVREPGAVVTAGPNGGILVRGITPGVHRLSLDSGGLRQRWLVKVRRGVALRGGQNGTVPKVKLYTAGNGWADQPRYSQRVDLHRWCDAVGCGPTALAIMITWLEHHKNVPSAWWNRDTANLPERLLSLRSVDSPLSFKNGDDAPLKYLRWYDWLHDLCDVWCWATTDAGTTFPHDMGEALIEYAGKVSSNTFTSSLGLSAGKVIDAAAHWENDPIFDDWDESGKLLADTIKAGRPGEAFYYELCHYVVAYAYRRTDYITYEDGEEVDREIMRAFRCNMGWGSTAQWLNAYDIDGCYLLDLVQVRTP